MNLDRAKGALWGQAIGDAVGTTQEFHRPREVIAFPALALEPQTDLVGGGPFRLEAGQITDDTQMAICLSESLVACGGYDADDAARRYVEWSKHAFDIGAQTSGALRRVASGMKPIDAGFAVWNDAGRRPAANGSLMRAAPLGVFFADRRQTLADAVVLDAAITHADPRCRIATSAYVAAISACIEEGQPIEAAHGGMMAAVFRLSREGRTPNELIEAAMLAVTRDLHFAEQNDPQLYGPEVHLLDMQGFVRVAFRLAFWHFIHTPRFEDVVLDCANRGGDADTNAAIAGALCGARDGEAKIPEKWRRKVENACASMAPTWADTYHPRRLFRLLESRGN